MELNEYIIVFLFSFDIGWVVDKACVYTMKDQYRSTGIMEREFNFFWNLQVSDSTLDFPCNHPLHDPLFKVRPFLDMMEKKFKQSYKCGRDLSFDQGCCPFKGKIWFKCYNPSKPNSTKCAKIAKILDPDCTQTTKTVVGQIQKCNLVWMGHHIYLDNYYCSPELFSELHYLETFACGTEKEFTESSNKSEIEEER